MGNTFLLELDGALGEGGGQVLRTALTLSAITGTPFRIHNIRAGRARPGLLRQHLTAAEAMAAICDAHLEGAVVGSTELAFRPGRIRGGDYRFTIGTAGSCTLVLQTVLPALWFADGPSRVDVSGGTHNKAAPPADFLQRVWHPLVARMGVRQHLKLVRHGFYPAGGGRVEVVVEPCGGLRPLLLSGRGELRRLGATAIVAGVPGAVAQRELAQTRLGLPAVETGLRVLPELEGPGNALLIEVEHDAVTELFTGFGEKGRPAEVVAEAVVRETQAYLRSGAAVAEHLADQLLLPLALAGGGAFTTNVLSSHLRTNAVVIGRFLAVRVAIDEDGSGGGRVVVGTGAG